MTSGQTAQTMKTLPAMVQSAMRLQDDMAHGSHTLQPVELAISRAAAETILQWRIDPTLATALLLTPLLTAGVEEEALRPHIAPESLDLAKQWVKWRIDHPLHSKTSVEWSSRALSILFREAYLQLPHLRFILLLMAEHDARLTQSDTRTVALAELTRDVLVPLAEMLGMWRVRQQWIDESLALLEPDEYSEKQTLWRNRNLNQRAHIFTSFAADVRNRAVQQHLSPLPRLVLRDLTVGDILVDEKRGEALEDVLSRVVISILCHSVEDCYHALGIVHSIGRPVRDAYTDRTDDYIAVTPLNGYQALHTAVAYTVSGKRTAIIRVQIQTTQMARLNELGVVAGLHTHARIYTHYPAWWSVENRVTSRQSAVSGDLTREELLELLSRNAVGSESPVLYVFTPKGGVFKLENNSSPVDFAYRIHSDIGDHMAGVKVNGIAVPVNYVLHNGDIVQIQVDNHAIHTDLSWLSCATTPYARKKIHQSLMRHTPHPGYAKIQKEIFDQFHFYALKRSYSLRITTQRLESFLMEVVRSRRLPGVLGLYAEVASYRIAPSALVRSLITRAFNTGITYQDGSKLPYGEDQTILCDTCRPVPGDELIAWERMRGGRLELVVHRKPMAGPCEALKDNFHQTRVKWLEENASLREGVSLQVHAVDHHQLLQDLLSPVYQTHDVRLSEVSATVGSDGSAQIDLAFEADNLANIIAVQNALEHVTGVYQVLSFPRTPAQRLSAGGTPGIRRNPYVFEREVYDRSQFYDRETQIQRMLDWLKQPLPTSPLLLYGKQRVGKTSIAHHLIHEVLPVVGIAQPVFVDMQSVAPPTIEKLTKLLISGVYGAIKQPTPEQRPREALMQWLSRSLNEAIQAVAPLRLLVFIDEFNHLAGLATDGLADDNIYTNLRALFAERRDMNWILIVQEATLEDVRNWGSLMPIIQQSRKIEVPHLDENWTLKLVVDPAKRNGIMYEDERYMQQVVAHLSGGNPFIIQYLCYLAIEAALRQTQNRVTRADIEEMRQTAIDDTPRILQHFVRYLSGLYLIVARLVAQEASGNPASVKHVLGTLARRLRISQARLGEVLKRLADRGVVCLDGVFPEQTVSMPVGLLQDWLTMNVNLDDEVRAWRMAETGKGARGATK